MAKSNNKVALKSVVVVRDGKRVSPPIGKSFPFTEDEVEAILASNPGAIRDAVNEDDEADLASIAPLGNSNTRVITKRVKAGAGLTSAMKDGLDGAAPTGEGASDSATGKTPAKPKKPADDDL